MKTNCADPDLASKTSEEAHRSLLFLRCITHWWSENHLSVRYHHQVKRSDVSLFMFHSHSTPRGKIWLTGQVWFLASYQTSLSSLNHMFQSTHDLKRESELWELWAHRGDENLNERIENYPESIGLHTESEGPLNIFNETYCPSLQNTV